MNTKNTTHKKSKSPSPPKTKLVGASFISKKIIQKVREDNNDTLSTILNTNQLKKKEPNYNVSMLKKPIQLKLNRTKILLLNLTSSITELSKILILAGFNVYLYDKEIITKNDAINNIYLTEEDIGKNRLERIFKQLTLLTSTVTVSMAKDYTKIKDYRVAIAGFSDFNVLTQYEEYFNRKGIMFYCINTSGLYGFWYHNLTKKIISNFWEENEEKFIETQNSNLNNFIRKSDKFFEKDKILENDYLIASIFLMELYYRKNVDTKNLKCVLNDELNKDNKFMAKMFFIENYLKKKKYNNLLNNANLMDTLRKFIINFNRELNPICSLMAQKIFNIVFESFLNGSYPKEMMITYSANDLNDFDYNSFI